ncbi:crossover junction endodeoxyribonuclease RuvC [Zhaonella formicivorans]|uniref:crossover junction endodeoxyribonuclease RuvC n=1 Tax=Zhaonella formicivorans TaxID=2528593 RepID=UPI0010D8BFB5|nr:crossover junction endodeoxyribonuclease RuvC [Zhaonella formicivorans]
MLILGIDPGTAITGYGIVQFKGNKFTVIDYGSIQTCSKIPLAERLKMLYSGLQELISFYKPEHLAVEELFFNKNSKTALAVGQARGVVLLAGANNKMVVAEYTPLQVKQAVVGYGRAEKQQVQEMVRLILNLEKVPKPDDVADALAITICHGHSYRVKNILQAKDD